jgi:hypothetical protein
MMNFELLGFLPLFFSLIIIAIFQGAAALGTMYLLHQDRTLPEIMLRWTAIALPAAAGFSIMSRALDLSIPAGVIFVLAVLSYVLIAGLYRLKPFVQSSVYGTFDFRDFQRPAFQDLIVRLAAIFLPLTLIVHILDYLFVARQINLYTIQIGAALFAVEVAGIAVGFRFILGVEKERVILLTVVSAIFYLVVLWYLIDRQMLI